MQHLPAPGLWYVRQGGGEPTLLLPGIFLCNTYPPLDYGISVKEEDLTSYFQVFVLCNIYQPLDYGTCVKEEEENLPSFFQVFFKSYTNPPLDYATVIWLFSNKVHEYWTQYRGHLKHKKSWFLPTVIDMNSKWIEALHICLKSAQVVAFLPIFYFIAIGNNKRLYNALDKSIGAAKCLVYYVHLPKEKGGNDKKKTICNIFSKPSYQ